MAKSGGSLAGTPFLIAMAKLKRIRSSGCTLLERTDLMVELYNLLNAKYGTEATVRGKYLDPVLEYIRTLRSAYESRLESDPYTDIKKMSYSTLLDEAEFLLGQLIEEKNTLRNLTITSQRMDRPDPSEAL
jgi:hypothetical protein